MTTGRVFSKAHPPRNRVSTGLGVIEIEIVGADQTVRLDPNAAMIAALTQSLDLGAPHAPSALSGSPGYLYRTEEGEFALTKDEIMRMLRRELEPHEALALLEKFGAAFDWHDDFYDEETGEALQPMSERYIPRP